MELMAWYDNIFNLENVYKCIPHQSLSVPYICLQAVWYTENQGLDGPVFGSADLWNGVGIFFDSFDNDGKVYDCCPREYIEVC